MKKVISYVLNTKKTAGEPAKDPNTIDPEISKLIKKLIKKYDKVWKELAKL